MKIKEKLRSCKERVKWIIKWSRKQWLWGFYRTRAEAFVKCMLTFWSWN